MKTFCPEGWLNDKKENKRLMLTPSALTEAHINGEILESVALLCDAEHNLVVNLGCMKGIIPRDEGAIGIESGKTRDIALISRVGKPVSFMVTDLKIDEHGKLYGVLSRRKAQQKCIDQYISTMRVGDVINAKVTHLESFGAFCDIGCGIIALLPIDSISVSRIAHPKDRFSPGDDIKVVVKGVADDGRITLSSKELLGTWEENANRFKTGQTVSGIVRSVEDYGVFVELAPNLAGLAELKQGVRVGQTASVYIKSIIPEKMKIKLIIIDSFLDTAPPKPIEYMEDREHIDYWQYSPDNCQRRIVSEFKNF